MGSLFDHYLCAFWSGTSQKKAKFHAVVIEQPEEWIELHILNQTHAKWELQRNWISLAETRHIVDDKVTIAISLFI